MTENLKTKSEFAKSQGWSKSHVSQLINAGRMVLDGEGKYANVFVAESLALIEATKDLSKTGVAQRHENERQEKNQTENHTQAEQTTIDFSGERAGSVYQVAKAQKEKYNALIAKLEYEKAIGKLLDANDVILAVSRAASDLRGQLETLPERFAVQFAAENDPQRIKHQAAETIEHLLSDIEKHFRKIAQESNRETK